MKSFNRGINLLLKQLYSHFSNLGTLDIVNSKMVNCESFINAVYFANKYTKQGTIRRKCYICLPNLNLNNGKKEILINLLVIWKKRLFHLTRQKVLWIFWFFLIENYVWIFDWDWKKNSFLLDVEINGLINTYCDRCGDPLDLSIKACETFLKKNKPQSSIT